MPRPTTKPDLISAGNTSFAKLTKLWDEFTPDQTHAPFPEEFKTRGTEAHWRRDTCLRDVVIHLHEWHNLVTVWVSSNQAGTPTSFFPQPYTWRNYAALNERFVDQHQNTPYEAARVLLAKSHQQVLAMIDGFTHDELFTKKFFTWTGTTSLGSYFVSATSSHYEWAAKKTRAYARILSSSSPSNTRERHHQP